MGNLLIDAARVRFQVNVQSSSFGIGKVQFKQVLNFIQHHERLFSNHSFNFTITISSSPAELSAVSRPMMLRTFHGCVIGLHAACNQGRKSLNRVIIIFEVPDKRFESLIKCAISKVNYYLRSF